MLTNHDVHFTKADHSSRHKHTTQPETIHKSMLIPSNRYWILFEWIESNRSFFEASNYNENLFSFPIISVILHGVCILYSYANSETLRNTVSGYRFIQEIPIFHQRIFFRKNIHCSIDIRCHFQINFNLWFIWEKYKVLESDSVESLSLRYISNYIWLWK